MAGIWKTQHNYPWYITNMLKKKGFQPVHLSSNDIWSRDLDINNTNRKEIVCGTTQHETKHAQDHL